MKLLVYVLLGIGLLTQGCAPSKPTDNAIPATGAKTDGLHRLVFDSPQALRAFLQYQPGRDPILSAHRGGPLPGYPENCLETFAHSISLYPAVLECDVRQTADGFFILMHDRSLDRTTTGTGLVADRTLQYIKNQRLKDNNGNLTDYHAPTLEEALHWAEGKTVLALDIKGDVNRERLLTVLNGMDAHRYAYILPNGLEPAEWYHLHDSLAIISLGARSLEEWRTGKDYQIDYRRAVAWVGTRRPSQALIDTLHANGMLVNIGTLGNLDRSTEARDGSIYRELRSMGVDFFATDSLQNAGAALLRQTAAPAN